MSAIARARRCSSAGSASSAFFPRVHQGERDHPQGQALGAALDRVAELAEEHHRLRPRLGGPALLRRRRARPPQAARRASMSRSSRQPSSAQWAFARTRASRGSDAALLSAAWPPCARASRTRLKPRDQGRHPHGRRELPRAPRRPTCSRTATSRLRPRGSVRTSDRPRRARAALRAAGARRGDRHRRSSTCSCSCATTRTTRPSAPRSPFLHEDAFAKRTPKKGLITKREVRLLSLAFARDRGRTAVVWDIGAGSGSVVDRGGDARLRGAASTPSRSTPEGAAILP